MDIEHFDAIIVGAGQAGPAIAARCSREGLKTAVIERHHFGGTCVNVGCVPTKTLVASARAMHLARRGAEFGFDTGGVRVDMARVMARKNGIVGTSRQAVEGWMRGLKHTEVIVGDARFVAASTLEDPALGRVGMTEAEAVKTGRKMLRAKMPMQRVGRAREAGETQGFMKVLVDAESELLVGAAILGLNGDEVVHGLLDGSAPSAR